MNLELLNKIDKLKEDVKESNEYKNLEIATKEMENDEEIQLLCYKKDMIILEYEDATKIYKKNSEELLDIQKKLANIMEVINSKEKVIQYNNALNEYNKLLEYINKEVFGVIND